MEMNSAGNNPNEPKTFKPFKFLVSGFLKHYENVDSENTSIIRRFIRVFTEARTKNKIMNFSQFIKLQLCHLKIPFRSQ